jgi:14-3-3 protein epsilon
MSNVNFENLSLQDEEGFVFDLEEGEEEVVDFRWCLVGRLLGDRSIHVNSMKVTMADVWRPVKGVKIKEATAGLFLFQFAHALDMEAVLQGGPWAFNNQMLIVERVQLGVQIENIPLNHVDFWIQVHNLPTGLMAERVGKTLANYIGSFVEYDKNNKGSFWREYMRIRVRVDIRQPLKKESRVKNQGGNWCTVNFKYEKLGVFCFVCGLIGHGENRCAIRFSMSEDVGIRAWSKELRADPRRRSSRQTSRWLTEEDGGRTVHGDGNFHGSSSDQAYTTRPANSDEHNNVSRQTLNMQSLPCSPHVPPFTSNNQNLTHIPLPQPMNRSIITTSSIKLDASQQSHANINLNQSEINQQPLLTINAPDNTLITQSLPIITQSVPHQSQPITAYTMPPVITDALRTIPSNHFSFNATIGPTPQQLMNPLTHPIKTNPTQKITRTSLTRSKTKQDPNKTNPTQNQAAAMETQTEKKRRRGNEQEKQEDVSIVQHFLTAGPGSQDCRDQ